MTDHAAERFMRRALHLASRGRHASPNPMVGCVLVAPDGTIVGEGYHPQAGQPHAEIFALRSADGRARGATAYVTLEPCSHYGRTPPCAIALVEAGVARVVTAMTDPDPRVAGRGVSILRQAGIETTVGLLETEARSLNAAYIKHRITGLPWGILKTAMTLDGKIATHTGDSKWITSPIARRAVHRQLRDRTDAILTGIGTVLADDPSLTTRLIHRKSRDPLRVVADSQARTPLDSNLVRQSQEDGNTIIAVTAQADADSVAKLAAHGCRVWECASDANGRIDLADLMRRLGTEADVISVLIESGGELAANLLHQGLIDRWLAFIAPKIVGGRDAPGPLGSLSIDRMAEAMTVMQWRTRRCGPDLVIDARF